MYDANHYRAVHADVCLCVYSRVGDLKLYVAASVDCSDTLKALLAAGVNVNALNSACQSALYLALKSDKPHPASHRAS